MGSVRVGRLLIAVTIDAGDGAELLRVVGDRLGDLSEPFRKMGEAVLEDARGTILSQGALAGEAWAPMSPLTSVVAAKLYGRGRDPRTRLYDTRGLLDSLTPDGPGNILEVGPTSLEAGSDYRSERTGYAIAKYQQEGTGVTFHVLQGSGYSAVGTPGRPFLGWREARLPEFEVLLAEHVIGAEA